MRFPAELPVLRGARAYHEGVIGEHELKTTPLFTLDAWEVAQDALPQRALLGSVLEQASLGLPVVPADERIYLNTNAPLSGLVCGVQGSGKSHTVSCILENCLLPQEEIGRLSHPLSALVFHIDEQNSARPCEAAFLTKPSTNSASAPRVENCVVMVSPSNLPKMRRIYAQFPNVVVRPLKLAEKDLNVERMLSLMGCDDIERMPLYMHVVLMMLREMGSECFDYQEFKQQIKTTELDAKQRMMINMRLDVLDSFVSAQAADIRSFFGQGRLVIVDLTDPFVDAMTAAVLFDMVLELFIEHREEAKIVVLDEAHKYLTNSEASRLNRTLASVIRQQRHFGTRVIIATQEPTVVPDTILDLASFIVCHRFSSPSWGRHLGNHVSVSTLGNQAADAPSWLSEVARLRAGQCLIFAPSALVLSAAVGQHSAGSLVPLGSGYLRVHVRSRITSDGGASVMAAEAVSGTAETSDFVEAALLSPPQTASRCSPNEERTRHSDNCFCIDCTSSLSGPTVPGAQLPSIGTVGSERNIDLTPVTQAGGELMIQPVSAIRPGLATHEQAPIASILPLPVPANQHPPVPATFSFAADAKPSTTAKDVSEFQDLICVLNELSDQGLDEPHWTPVKVQLLRRRANFYPSCGFDSFQAYSNAAASAGIVHLTKVGSRDCIRLATRIVRTPTPVQQPLAARRETSERNGSSPDTLRPAPIAFPSQTVSDASSRVSQDESLKFRDLVAVLSKMRDAGVVRPHRSNVGERLLQLRADFYPSCGFASFKNYSVAAAAAGVVQLIGHHEIRLAGARTIGPTVASGPSGGTQPSSAQEHTAKLAAARPRYQTLIKVLQKHRDAGTEKPTRTKVAGDMFALDPCAFETGKFNQFITSAATAEIVTLGGFGNAQWIRLKD